jgi:hypothetical protein
VAVLATVAAFTVPTWLCGAVLMPPLVNDPAIRWSLSSALGAVLAPLAASWGHAFATRAQATEPAVSRRLIQALGTRAVAIGGDNQASVSTGDATPPAQSAPAEPAVAQDPSPLQTDTVSASGNRSIAIGGNNSGQLFTGDQPGSARP